MSAETPSQTTGAARSGPVPQVSVLMPCFNAVHTLDEAVSSILRQSMPDFELIAVDDGSSDATADRLRQWSAQDRRVRLLEREHAGIIEALNWGLAQCRGSLVARMDADDRSHPDRLARQMEHLAHHPQLAGVGCLVEGIPAGQVRQGYQLYLDWLNRLISPGQIAREIFIESPLPHPSMMVRRAWLDRVGGYQDHGWPEDYDLWLRMHLAGARFAKVPAVLFGWREHPGRLTRTDSRYSVENFLRAKAHYLVRGPLLEADGLVLWGAGQMGRRIAKHLVRQGAPLQAVLDVDPKKVGRQLRGAPVVRVDALPELWRRYERPVLLAAVGSRGARGQIREHLISLGLLEGADWWAVA